MFIERVGEKNICRFCDGKPLVAFIQEALVASEFVGRVYTHWSDEAIQGYLVGGVEFLKRPEFLDGNDANCNCIIREFMKDVDVKIYSISHAEASFTRTESVDRSMRAVAGDEPYDSVFTVECLPTFLWSNEGPVNFGPSISPVLRTLICST